MHVCRLSARFQKHLHYSHIVVLLLSFGVVETRETDSEVVVVWKMYFTFCGSVHQAASITCSDSRGVFLLSACCWLPHCFPGCLAVWHLHVLHVAVWGARRHVLRPRVLPSLLGRVSEYTATRPRSSTAHPPPSGGGGLHLWSGNIESFSFT